MHGDSFVRELLRENEGLLRKLDAEPQTAEVSSGAISGLLKAALKNEMEAAEIAAAWVPSTQDLATKIALGRHAGDEARHYDLLQSAAAELGVDLAGFHPLVPPSPVLEYLRTLSTDEERVAAALVTREAMGARRNAQFLNFLEAAGYASLARLYRETINRDEELHHRTGCILLARLAINVETQQRARQAAARLLEIGDRMRDAFLQKTGAAVMPGC